MEKISKNYRILNMYQRLCSGKCLNKQEEAKQFGVDERSIQRDIDDIRAFLMEQTDNSGDSRQVVYDRSRKGYVLTGAEQALMSNDEILAVSKILLESRAFTKKEIKEILDKMILGCVPQKNMKLVSARENVKRVIQPVGLIFSEYYFYLNAFIVEKDDTGKYVQKYDYPAIFRVDRIKSYQEVGEKFKIAYADRFEEGEFRKRVQFMFPGKLTRIKLKYTGRNVEAVLDRLPTAKILSETEDSYTIEADVYGKGILMWLLSQGRNIEVLKPQSMRKEMKKNLQDMLQLYK